MTKKELLRSLEFMTITDRLEIIEAATSLIREDLNRQSPTTTTTSSGLKDAVDKMASLYGPNTELTEFTDLDIEEFYEHF
ncbi:MAG: hypothetical protein GDA44_04240 [Prochloron sp. SP5CPC1]|nr:hypothetical protein [Candidatus Paraprochloron terpiosi SP5CPC1]